MADGLPLSVTATPAPLGHSIEFRINAEDVGRGFLPTPARCSVSEAPSGFGVRVDAGVQTGSVVPGTFDSLMAKLIVTGATREQATARARRALREFHIEGRGLGTALPPHCRRPPGFPRRRWLPRAYPLDRIRLRRAAGRRRAPSHSPTPASCAPSSRSTAAACAWDCRRS